MMNLDKERGLVDELRTDYYVDILSFQSRIESLNQKFYIAK